jgi:hypothetical protein
MVMIPKGNIGPWDKDPNKLEAQFLRSRRCVRSLPETQLRGTPPREWI